jgi:hypothetical protein
MKLRVLFGIFIIVNLTACLSTTQTIVSDKVIFYGEGEYWNVKYIYNPILYDEEKTNWVEIEMNELELSEENINNIDIEFESRDGLITGNVGNMETKIRDNVISFLVGTVNFNTYEEDEYKITIKFKDKQDVIKLQTVMN